MLKILSGGQTGVDRAGLDAAISIGLPYGGWCPKGGWAEDMPDPPGVRALYPELRETPHTDPRQRTEWNIRDGDGVLILSAKDPAISKGTLFAVYCAKRLGRPLLIVDFQADTAVANATSWLHGRGVARLSIGGPRESEVPGIYAMALAFLLRTLRPWKG